MKKAYWRQHYQMYLLLVPGLIFLAVFKFTPLLGLTIAFKDYNILAGENILDSIIKSPWVGLDNFRRVLLSKSFSEVLGNSLIISTQKLLFLFPLPIVFAILLNEVRKKSIQKTIQTLVYLPHFLSWVIVFGLAYAMLGSEGMLNSFLVSLGMPQIRFFTDKALFRPLLIFSEGWKETGWSSIVYLSAITTINLELYEAAMVDGANKWRQIFHITLPGITPIVLMMLILRVGSILQAGFEQILVMYNPSVYKVADIIDTYVYRMGLGKLDFSLGTTMGLFNSVISFVLILSANKLSRKVTGRGLW